MKKKVSPLVMRHLLGRLCDLDEAEANSLTKRNHRSKEALSEIIHEYIVPSFQKHDPKSRQIIRDSLEYYLEKNSVDAKRESEMDRFLYMYDVPINPRPEHEFFWIVWSKLFSKSIPIKVELSEYEEDPNFDLEIKENKSWRGLPKRN